MNKEIKKIKNTLKVDFYKDIIKKDVSQLILEEKIVKAYEKETNEILNKEDPESNNKYIDWVTNLKTTCENKQKKIKCAHCETIIKYTHKNKPKECPNCGDKYWDKPKTEYQLFCLQENYLKTKDNKILGEMYTILKLYAKKLIVIMVKGSFYFKKDELECKAHDSANKVIIYYLTKPEFKIESSFGGYLGWPIRNVLYADKNNYCDSLNCMIDREYEIEDYLATLSEETREKMIVHFDDSIVERTSNIDSVIIDLIQKIGYRISKNFDLRENLLFLIGIKNRCKALPQNFMDNYYLYCGDEVKLHMDNALALVYKKIKKAEE